MGSVITTLAALVFLVFVAVLAYIVYKMYVYTQSLQNTASEIPSFFEKKVWEGGIKKLWPF